MKRRDLLKLLGTGAVAGAVPRDIEAATKPGRQAEQTHVYKTVGDCRIKADVWGAGTAGSKRPVMLTIHGGALIMGGRQSIDLKLFGPLLDQGYTVVSIDYRLAPETMLPGIIDDLRDAWKWLREQGPDLFGADPDRIGVHGGSAGGYLTLMAGFCLEPRPRALVSDFGYGNIVGDWLTRPDTHYRTQPLVSAEQARAGVGTIPLSEYAGQNRRHDFYLYCRQQGRWPREVTGLDPQTMLEAFKPYCPVYNVTPEYPPTLLRHGTDDHDVPYEQSVEMAAELARAGVPHEFIPLQKADHGFAGAHAEAMQSARQRAVAFILHYVPRPSVASKA